LRSGVVGSARARTIGHSKNQLYSEDEVTNPGYPGALLIVGVPSWSSESSASMGIRQGELVGTALVGVFFLLPGASVVIKSMRARRARRREPRTCPACGYDRRGLTADGNCPECGAAPTR
jgi:hypothetical protein